MNAQWIDKKFKPVDKRDDAGKVYGWVRGETDRPPVVLDGKKPFGVVDSDAFMSRHVHRPSNVDEVAWPVPVLAENADPADLMAVFANDLVPYAPVKDRNGKLAGVVHPMTLLKEYVDQGPPVRDIYVQVPRLRKDDNVVEAMKAFRRTRTRQLPVVDDKRRCIGVIEQTTLARLQDQVDHGVGRQEVVGENIDLMPEPVGGYMTESWPELPLDATWDDLVDKLDRFGYTIITWRGKVKGIITPTYAVQGVHRMEQGPGGDRGRGATIRSQPRT